MGKRNSGNGRASGAGGGKPGAARPLSGGGRQPAARSLKGFFLKCLGGGGERRRRAALLCCCAVGIALLAGLAAFLARPRMLWHVDEEIAASWNMFLHGSSPPASRFEVRRRLPGEPFPRGRFGFVVTMDGPQGNPVPGAPLSIYPDLNRTRTFDGWQVLALDPWMVFRRHYIPEPSRAFLSGDLGRGSLLLAGSDPRAVQAWASQLLQESPRVFAQGEDAWREKSEGLVRDYPFQSGAFAFAWIHTWPMLFRDEPSFLYAPLSQARAFAHTARHSAGLLDATTFPEPAGWNEFGLQAEMLWARPVGGGRRRERLEATERWLGAPSVQSRIANEFEWIPAHPSGTPFNTVSWQSHIAWLRSSFIWRGKEVAHAD